MSNNTVSSNLNHLLVTVLHCVTCKDASLIYLVLLLAYFNISSSTFYTHVFTLARVGWLAQLIPNCKKCLGFSWSNDFTPYALTVATLLRRH